MEEILLELIPYRNKDKDRYDNIEDATDKSRELEVVGNKTDNK